MTRSTSVKQSTQVTHSLIQRQILQLQQILRIQDWDIEISTKQPQSSDHLLEIVMNRRRKHAAIRISNKALSLGRSEFTHCLVHELVHVIFDELDYWAVSAVPLAGPSRISWTEYEELRERAVDHIAKVVYTAISQLDMPL